MSRQQGSLREVMPVAAELVDWLREQFGREYADKLVRQGQAEIGPDGVFRIGPAVSTSTTLWMPLQSMLVSIA
jgi:plasmid maintenance system antidote protein VapI